MSQSTTLSDLAAEAMRQRRTTPTLVADVLRDAILRGLLPGGKQLRQDEVAAQFGISRIPVREALRQLHAEGLVTLVPNRGAVVSELAPEEIVEIYEIRIALECLAVRLAVSRTEPAVFERAEAVLAAIDREDDVARWCDLNRDFHATLYAPCSRQRLLALIDTYRVNVDRYLRIYISLIHHKGRSQIEHRSILDAYRQGDAATAEAAVAAHLQGVAREIAEYLERRR